MGVSIFRKDGTAQAVAKQRLIESLAAPDKRVITDPYAASFVTGAGLIKLMGNRLNTWLYRKILPGFHEHIISRTRHIDDLIESCAANGVEQYVILGAGYDLRAHRLNLPSGLKIFEVDQREVQARKRSKLPKSIPNGENVCYVSIDFNHQNLKDQLLQAGFCQNKSTVFTLEGVSQYIPKSAISATIQELAELTGKTDVTFYMSYVNALLNEQPKDCFGEGYPKPEKITDTLRGLSERVGEPWVSYYSDNEITQLLAESGFTVVENKTMEDLNSRYFSPLGRGLPEHEIFKIEHFVIAKS